MAHPYDAELETYLADQGVPFHVRKTQGTGWAARRHQLEALERWYASGWSRLDTRLRSSITEGVVVFLSLFDDNPAVHRAFCPPRSAYLGQRRAGRATAARADRRPARRRTRARPELPGRDEPRPGPHHRRDAEAGLPARGAAAHPEDERPSRERVWRDLLFVCDEYHAFATVGETDPTGDERTFALSRQARLIPIVATQSISSLRSVLPGDESWRTLLQCFRNKVFLATSDEFTARNAAELCGRKDRLKAHYSLSESGRDAHVSLLTGRAAAATPVAHGQQELRADVTSTSSRRACSRSCRTPRPSSCRTTASIRCRRSSAT